MEQDNLPSLTMRDYVRVLFRQKAVIITSFLTVVATVFIGLKFKTPVYEAKVKMLISAEKQVEATYYREIGNVNRSQEMTLTQSEIVNSNPVIERAVKATGLYARPFDYEKNFADPMKKSYIAWRSQQFQKRIDKLKANEDQIKAYMFRIAVEDLKAHVKVEPIRDTNMFTISVRDYSPYGCAVLANVISRSYTIFDLEQQLAELQLKYGEKHQSYVQLKDNIDRLVKGLNGEPLPDLEAMGPASVKVIEQAQVPLEPSGLPKLVTMLLGVLMAIFLSVMLAFTFEYMDQTFKSPHEVETYLDVPYLGAVMRKAKIDEYRLIADQLRLVIKDKNLKTLMFNASLPHEGLTTTVVNLGTYLGKQSENKVLIIDANLRSPAAHKAFKLPVETGISEVLEGKIPLEKAIKEISANLHLMTAGKSGLNPITLLSSHAMQDIVKVARTKYNIILIDCAELGEYKDSLVLADIADGVVLVVNEGKTRRQVVKTAIQPLIDRKLNLLGVILNNRTFAIPEMIYNRV